MNREGIEDQVWTGWGLWAHCPDGVRAAWGARAISEVQGYSLLNDRQTVHSKTSQDEADLIKKLNGDVLKAVRQKVIDLKIAGHMKGDDTERYTLFEDDEVKVMGTPNGSYGYIYIIAWLKK